MYLAFLDTEKAYDTVNRNLLYSLLNRTGLSDGIVSITHNMYEDTRTIYRLGKSVEEERLSYLLYADD